MRYVDCVYAYYLSVLYAAYCAHDIEIGRKMPFALTLFIECLHFAGTGSLKTIIRFYESHRVQRKQTYDRLAIPACCR